MEGFGQRPFKHTTSNFEWGLEFLINLPTWVWLLAWNVPVIVPGLKNDLGKTKPQKDTSAPPKLISTHCEDEPIEIC